MVKKEQNIYNIEEIADENPFTIEENIKPAKHDELTKNKAENFSLETLDKETSSIIKAEHKLCTNLKNLCIPFPHFTFFRSIIVFQFLLIAFILSYYLHHYDTKEWNFSNLILKRNRAIQRADNYDPCNLPDLPLYSEEMIQLNQEVTPIVFEKSVADWVTCKNFECKLSDKHKTSALCKFTDIIRINDDVQGTGWEVTHNTHKLSNSDVVAVNCSAGNETWNSILASIRYDREIWKHIGWERTAIDGLKLNVLIFCIDSVSANAVKRKFPKTYNYITDTLQGLVFKGYNIVGDGAPQALIPLLTGRLEMELPVSSVVGYRKNFLDSYPLIWNEFKSNGYVTALLDESPYAGIFNSRSLGFDKQPTDHYLRCYSLNEILNEKICKGNITRHKVMLNYANDFISLYKSEPKFMFSFLEAATRNNYNAHDVADKDIMNFLKQIKISGSLNDSLLIFMGAHGCRFRKKSTMQSKIEERLPFLSLVFPDWFKTFEAYKNLENNLETLVTPFDIHATLRDVLHLSGSREANMSERSLSLFSKIPKNRSCAQANIEPHWCTCLKQRTLLNNSDIVRNLKNYFVQVLNNFTATERHKCQLLNSSRVIFVNEFSPNPHILKYKGSFDLDGFDPDLSDTTVPTYKIYKIKILLNPGELLFEATIKQDTYVNRLSINLSDVNLVTMENDNYQNRCLKNNYMCSLKKYL